MNEGTNVKKASVAICDKQISLPLDLLGRPTTISSWVAKADFSLDEENFVITITRKEFQFNQPHLFRDYEAEAKKGFLGKNDYEVKRMQGSQIYHHIPARKFIAAHPILKGQFEFAVQKETNDGVIQKVTLTLDVSEFPKDFDQIMKVRSLLVG